MATYAVKGLWPQVVGFSFTNSYFVDVKSTYVGQVFKRILNKFYVLTNERSLPEICMSTSMNIMPHWAKVKLFARLVLIICNKSSLLMQKLFRNKVRSSSKKCLSEKAPNYVTYLFANKFLQPNDRMHSINGFIIGSTIRLFHYVVPKTTKTQMHGTEYLNEISCSGMILSIIS